MTDTAKQFDYDAELLRYHARLLAALDVRPDDVVVDIGCGAGQATRDAARAAAAGAALGVDVSEQRLDVARQLAGEAGLTNVSFVCADAQTHPFPAASFDLGLSRFGTMFFTDPDAAFRNIARALRPGARFVQIVWQRGDQQEWSTVLRDVFGRESTPASGANAFSLADPGAVEEIMTGAGFTAVDFVDLREPVYYGRDAEAALAAMLLLKSTQDFLAALDDRSAAFAVEALRGELAARENADGVFFDSAAWLITAIAP